MEVPQLKAFEGVNGRCRLVNALLSQPLVHDEDLAREIAKHVRLEAISSGATLINQGASDTDLFFILSGEFSIVASGQIIARKDAGEQVGEMAVVDPTARRSASAIAACDSVVARISESEFTALAEKFPRLWRRIALELATRLRSEGEALPPVRSHGRAA
jgi:CRP-like cAMP-binding protein